VQPLVAPSLASVASATAIPAKAASNPSASAPSGSATKADSALAKASVSSSIWPNATSPLQLLQWLVTQVRHGAPVLEAMHGLMQLLMLQWVLSPRQDAHSVSIPLPRRHSSMQGILVWEVKHTSAQLLSVPWSAVQPLVAPSLASVASATAIPAKAASKPSASKSLSWEVSGSG